MQAHTVIILTSGLAGKCSPDSLDRAIASLIAQKKSPVLVLGSDGDEILATCSRLEDCEITFDPNQSGPFSGVKAGLHATETAAFVWQIDCPFPEPIVWNRIETALRLDEEKKSDLLSVKNDPARLLAVTAMGNARLKKRPATSAWPKAEDIVFATLEC